MTTSVNPATKDFATVLQLPAPPATVAELFLSADGVSRWWGPTTGEGKPGGTLVTTFGEYGANAMRVVEATPARIVWEPVVPPAGAGTAHQEEWLGTRVEIDIAPAGAGTELRFRHVGLTSQLKCWEACVNGWAQFMGSIELYATTGTGAPFAG